MRSTHTYAILEVSQEAYDEIHAKLKAAGYQHAFMDGNVIDMAGIGISADPEPLCLATTRVARAAGPEVEY